MLPSPSRTTTEVSETAEELAVTVMFAIRILFSLPEPVTSTVDNPRSPSMKSTTDEPVMTKSLFVLLNVESWMVILPDPAVSIPTSLPMMVRSENSISADVEEPYSMAGPAIFAKEPVSSPDMSFA